MAFLALELAEVTVELVHSREVYLIGTKILGQSQQWVINDS